MNQSGFWKQWLSAKYIMEASCSNVTWLVVYQKGIFVGIFFLRMVFRKFLGGSPRNNFFSNLYLIENTHFEIH